MGSTNYKIYALWAVILISIGGLLSTGCGVDNYLLNCDLDDCYSVPTSSIDIQKHSLSPSEYSLPLANALEIHELKPNTFYRFKVEGAVTDPDTGHQVSLWLRYEYLKRRIAYSEIRHATDIDIEGVEGIPVSAFFISATDKKYTGQVTLKINEYEKAKDGALGNLIQSETLTKTVNPQAHTFHLDLSKTKSVQASTGFVRISEDNGGEIYNAQNKHIPLFAYYTYKSDKTGKNNPQGDHLVESTAKVVYGAEKMLASSANVNLFFISQEPEKTKGTLNVKTY